MIETHRVTTPHSSSLLINQGIPSWSGVQKKETDLTYLLILPRARYDWHVQSMGESRHFLRFAAGIRHRLTSIQMQQRQTLSPLRPNQLDSRFGEK